MMSDESISQAEIDALVKGFMSPDGGSASEAGVEDAMLIQQTAMNYVGSAANALSELIGVPCEASVTEVRATTGEEAASFLSGQILVGTSDFGGGLSGTTYIVLPQDVAMAIISQLYGGIQPSHLDESALGALSEGLMQMVQAGAAQFAAEVGNPVTTSHVEAAAMQNLSEAPGVVPGDQVVVIQCDMMVGELTGKMLAVLPHAAFDVVVQAIREYRAARAKRNPEPGQSQSAAAAQALALEEERDMSPAAPAAPAVGGGGAHRGGASAQPVPYQTAQFPDLMPQTRPEEIRNIDLLMDVSLQVTVELGRTRKQIRDVLALGPGSVVELDKLAGEQVDVLVNGKLIAKGEVVVIDENYGVRISDIISPADRVQSLK